MNRTTLSVAICICTGLMFLPGCGSTSSNFGNQKLTQGNVSKIIKGVTTRDQLVQLFGEPDNSSLLPDGRRQLMYQGIQRNGDMSGTVARGVIPFAAFVPTTDTHTEHRQTLQIYVGADSIVQDYEFTDKVSETKSTVSALGGAHTEQTTPSDSGK